MKINTLILRNFWLVNWSNLFVNATKILVGLWQSWLLFAWGFLLLKLRILFGYLLPGDPVTGKLFDHGGDVIQGHSNLEGGVSLAESGRERFLKGSQNHIWIGSQPKKVFYNTTWAEERGESLPDLEFFPSVFSYLLEFLVFSWVLSFLPSIFLQFSFKILHFLFRYLKLVEF